MAASTQQNGVLVAVGQYVTLNTTGFAGIGFQLTGSWVGTVTFSGSVDGVDFTPLTVSPLDGTTSVTTATANGVWQAGTSLAAVRMVVTAYTSGYIVAWIVAGVSGAGASTGGGGGGLTFPDLASPPGGTALGASGAKYTDIFASGSVWTTGHGAIGAQSAINTASFFGYPAFGVLTISETTSDAVLVLNDYVGDIVTDSTIAPLSDSSTYFASVTSQVIMAGSHAIGQFGAHQSYISNQSTVDQGYIIGINTNVFNDSIHNSPFLAGVYVNTDNRSTGTIAESDGFYAAVGNVGGGTVTQLNAMKLQCVSTQSGTITTQLTGAYFQSPNTGSGATTVSAYGAYFEDQTVVGASTNYAIDVNAKFRVAPDGSALVVVGPVTATDFIVNGSRFKSDTIDTHTGGLAVYDVNATTYRDFLVWTNANAPAVVMSIPTTGTLSIDASTLTLNGSAVLTSVTAHDILSATHGDTTAASVVRGDLVTGQGATPKWTRLAKGAANQVLAMDGTATDVLWVTPAAGGVTSIATTSPISGGTITGTGTISLLVNTNFNWTAGQTITAPAGSTALTLAGGTQTTSFPALDISQTWNASGTTFTGIKAVFTTTASAAASLLLDLQAGASPASVVTIDKSGAFKTTISSLVAYGINVVGQPPIGIGRGSSGGLAIWGGAATPAGNNALMELSDSGKHIVMDSAVLFGWANTNVTQTHDTILTRGGAAATIQMGADVNGAAVNQTLQAANGITGTDKTGGNLTVASGKGTGAGAVSSLIFSTPTVLGSGTTAQSLAARLTLTSTTATWADALDFVFNATTGTKIGTATTQKLAFYNATPIVQGASVADATGGAIIDAEARTAINALISRIEATGLIATV